MVQPESDDAKSAGAAGADPDRSDPLTSPFGGCRSLAGCACYLLLSAWYDLFVMLVAVSAWYDLFVMWDGGCAFQHAN